MDKRQMRQNDNFDKSQLIRKIRKVQGIKPRDRDRQIEQPFPYGIESASNNDSDPYYEPQSIYISLPIEPQLMDFHQEKMHTQKLKVKNLSSEPSQNLYSTKPLLNKDLEMR